MSQLSGPHQEWLTGVPPGEVLTRLGGVGKVRELADSTGAEFDRLAVCRAFEEGHRKGEKRGLWTSQKGMASFLEVGSGWLNRILRMEENVAGMKFDDIQRCLRKLRTCLQIEIPNNKNTPALQTVVRRMWEARANGSRGDLGG